MAASSGVFCVDDAPSNPEQLVSGVTDLFTLPDIYVKVKALIDDPESSIGDIGDVVALDPGISARLLKFSNSAFYGLSRTIATVSHAVNILGTQTVHDIILATSVANAFSGMSSAFMNVEKFWMGSLYRGVVARLLATECNLLDSDRVFVQGLLSDIGHLVMYQEIPELAQAAAADAAKTGKALAVAERDLLGYNYAQVGGELMRVWMLPDSLTETVLHHADLARAENFLRETAIIHLAAHIEAAITAGLEVEDWELPVDQQAWQMTGLTPAVYLSIREVADESVSETREILF